ncbi:hypothetical protein B0H15DRAFT_424509 [Mycena belliarum]|uniref:Uncharacterized protein n=1 Tax=Mycena belliarum TaxID=1033014 RepID=A0AAD6XNH4_9AGAR|nr:hypothetical protein B0H15DRAFT_424509 [Mycena belliae]
MILVKAQSCAFGQHPRIRIRIILPTSRPRSFDKKNPASCELERPNGNIEEYRGPAREAPPKDCQKKSSDTSVQIWPEKAIIFHTSTGARVIGGCVRGRRLRAAPAETRIAIAVRIINQAQKRPSIGQHSSRETYRAAMPRYPLGDVGLKNPPEIPSKRATRPTRRGKIWSSKTPSFGQGNHKFSASKVNFPDNHLMDLPVAGA